MTLFSTIVAGRPGTQMGAFGMTLSADDVWDIIAFLRDETKARGGRRVDGSIAWIVRTPVT
jgi:hypothetical protein